MNQVPKFLDIDEDLLDFKKGNDKILKFDIKEIVEKRKNILKFNKENERYNVVNFEGDTRILNHTTNDGIQKLINGPFYERFPRGYYQDEMDLKESAFAKVYPGGYNAGPFTLEERKEYLSKKYLPPSEPDYNYEYEQLYGESLKEMKMIEAYNLRRENLIYEETNFIVDIIDNGGNIVREYVVNRDLPIKEFLTLIFGEGNRYPLEIITVDEINKSIASELNNWWYIEPIIKKISKKYEKNVYLTLSYPNMQYQIRSYRSLIFHGTTKTKDVFDIAMTGNLYKNFFIIRDVIPVFSDLSAKA